MNEARLEERAIGVLERAKRDAFLAPFYEKTAVFMARMLEKVLALNLTNSTPGWNKI
jgi:hypothetical protein